MDRKKVVLYDLQTGISINQIGVTNEQDMFLSTKFLGNSDMLAILEGRQYKNESESRFPWIYRDLKIRTLDEEGEESDQLSLEPFTIYQPALWYDSESQTLFFGHDQGWQKFKVSF